MPRPNTPRYRPIRTRQASTGPYINIADQSYLSFCSNDYLGLSQHPYVNEACKQAIDVFGVGSTASQWVCGYTDAHHALSEALVNWLDCQRVALFPSGYMANLGVLQALTQRHDHIFHDRENHASLIDAVQLTRCPHTRYRRTALPRLTTHLQHHTAPRSWLVTDAVFSMSGAVAPLEHLAQLTQSTHTGFIVDDAHGIGVLGPKGQGALSYTQTKLNQVTAYIITFGKAFGTAGAAVCGQKDLIEYIQQQARTLAFTTAPPPSIAAATLASLECMQNHPEYRLKLQSNIEYFYAKALSLQLKVTSQPTPIIFISTGDSTLALQWSDALKQSGIWVHPVRAPSVPPHQAGLRITLSSNHTRAHLDQLLETLHATQPQALLDHCH